jgi:uncharacterized protein
MRKFPYENHRLRHRGEALSIQRIEEILSKSEWGSLGTVSSNGEPYVVPISYAWDESDGSIIIHTYRKGQKIANIERDDRICFSIVGSTHLITDKFAAAYESVVIFGRIQEITDPDESLTSAIVFCRKFAPKIVAGMNAEEKDREINDLALMIDKALDTMVLFRIIPSHVSGKSRNMPNE